MMQGNANAQEIAALTAVTESLTKRMEKLDSLCADESANFRQHIIRDMNWVSIADLAHQTRDLSVSTLEGDADDHLEDIAYKYRDLEQEHRNAYRTALRSRQDVDGVQRPFKQFYRVLASQHRCIRHLIRHYRPILSQIKRSSKFSRALSVAYTDLRMLR